MQARPAHLPPDLVPLLVARRISCQRSRRLPRIHLSHIVEQHLSRSLIAFILWLHSDVGVCTGEIRRSNAQPLRIEDIVGSFFWNEGVLEGVALYVVVEFVVDGAAMAMTFIFEIK